MTAPLAYVRPGLVLGIWTGDGPLAEIALTRKHALALMADLARALADDAP